jgi:hypothetical protein
LCGRGEIWCDSQITLLQMSEKRKWCESHEAM